MIPLPTFKKLLGEDAQHLTDQQLEQIRSTVYQLAELAFDLWAKEKRLKHTTKCAGKK